MLEAVKGVCWWETGFGQNVLFLYGSKWVDLEHTLSGHKARLDFFTIALKALNGMCW